MADVSKSAGPSVVAIAGAGFRLSLVLNAVGVEIADVETEIQTIARAITAYSLILKQIGLNLKSPRSLASTSAIDSVSDVAAQSQTIFNEIKGMVEMVQKKDDTGHIQSIAIAQRVKWCFKKQRVQYLLGQLEVLKLSLSLMLQVQQMARHIANSREDPSRRRIQRRDMLQDSAEIQNMVVVRYWALRDLARLYELAEHETASGQLQLPELDRIEHPGGDTRLSIEPAPMENKDDQTKALVKYQETPLNQLDEKMSKALSRADQYLQSPKEDIVDLLLDKWTRLRHVPARHQPRRRRYGPHYETDTSDLSSSDFQGARREKGYYLENGHKPNSGHKSVKNVKFRARVESDTSDSDNAHHRARGKKFAHRSVLHSDESSTPYESDTSDSDSPPPRSRRSSDSTTTAMNTAVNSKYGGVSSGRGGDAGAGDRPRRPYTSGDGARPVSRGSAGSPMPQQAVPGQQQHPPFQPMRGMTVPNPNHGLWPGGAGPAPQSPGLRPPGQSGYYPQQQQQQQPPQQPRNPTSYGMPPLSPQQHPQNPPHPYLPRLPSHQQLPVSFAVDRSLHPPSPSSHRSSHHHHHQYQQQQPVYHPNSPGSSYRQSNEETLFREKEERRARRRERKRQEEIAKARKKAGLDEKPGGIKQKAKNGLIGAGAVAGLMDILQGLDGL